ASAARRRKRLCRRQAPGSRPEGRRRRWPNNVYGRSFSLCCLRRGNREIENVDGGLLLGDADALAHVGTEFVGDLPALGVGIPYTGFVLVGGLVHQGDAAYPEEGDLTLLAVLVDHALELVDGAAVLAFDVVQFEHLAELLGGAETGAVEVVAHLADGLEAGLLVEGQVEFDELLQGLDHLQG